MPEIVETRCWPLLWITRWIYPLFKKNAQCDPGNYRGLHLTAQLSKVVDRILLANVTPQITRNICLIGRLQFAYMPGRGSRDAIAFMILTWMTGFCGNRKFALYCSDVSGAFDHVRQSRLCEKLIRKGFPV